MKQKQTKTKEQTKEKTSAEIIEETLKKNIKAFLKFYIESKNITFIKEMMELGENITYLYATCPIIKMDENYHEAIHMISMITSEYNNPKITSENALQILKKLK